MTLKNSVPVNAAQAYLNSIPSPNTLNTHFYGLFNLMASRKHKQVGSTRQRHTGRRQDAITVLLKL